MKDGWRLHKYYSTLQSILRRIESCEYCLKINQKYMLDYYEFLVAQGLSIPRIAKCLHLAAKIDNVLKKDLKKLNKSDIIKYLGWMENSSYTEWTKKDFRVGLKKFIRWLNNDNEPDYFKIIKSTIKNKSKLLPQEILTQKEVMKLIKYASQVRDKAIISVLYESGCRIGEILTLKLKHIVFDEYGCLLNVNGKTGVRQVRIISSTSILNQWISDNPHSNNSDSYLWCSHKYVNNELIGYNSVKKVLEKTARRAGINKKVNPHAFRHARATHLATKLTEAQMKMYFGWTQSSKMAAVYVHLSGRDVDDAILKLHGIKKQELEKEEFSLQKCRCGENNPPNNKYCLKCGKPLSIETFTEIDENKEKANNIMNELMKNPEVIKLVQKMMVKTK